MKEESLAYLITADRFVKVSAIRYFYTYLESPAYG